ncbi:NfeD family protein [Gallibacterium trehalosifermentans]|uniref:NfeD family protein n=1 Tax=Gallibacterium trehalosifermentans TaxID=516935 RepID=A0ABV6GXZ3_9PAST
MIWLADWGAMHWLILAFILLILEIIVPGIFFLWWGIAGLIVAAMTYLFPLSGVASSIAFAVIAIIATLVWWRYQSTNAQQDRVNNGLNQRDMMMLGQQGKVTELVSSNLGRAAFGDTTWRIEGEQLQLNDHVEVVGVKGITLVVRKV